MPAPRPRTAGRGTRKPGLTLATSAAACAAIAVTGCSSAGTGAAAKPLKPAQAVLTAVTQETRLSSLTATMSMTLTATTAGKTETGTANMAMSEQLKPTALTSASLELSSPQQAPPGSPQYTSPQVMDEVANNDVYLDVPDAAARFHKPWVELSQAPLTSTAGKQFTSVVQQFQSNPLSETQLLKSATQVQAAGKAVINGVSTTEYTGTISIPAMINSLPFLKSLPTADLVRADVSVWIDAQHRIHKVTETVAGPGVQTTADITVTSINKPVRIVVPSASEVATLPGS